MATVEPVYLAAGEEQRHRQDTTSEEQQAKMTTTLEEQKLEPISLAESRASDQSENATSNSSSADEAEEEEEYHESEGEQQSEIKCSAVHSLERDMPDYDYTEQVVKLRELILEHARQNEGIYSQDDLEKCRQDNWFLSRFLLRNKMDLNEAFEMLKRAMRFNHESLANHLRAEDFPAEFYQLGGMFPYGHDRKGNKMLYMRIRVHRKTPEITSIVQAFIYNNIKWLDDEAQGKGISLVIDCSGGGLANADMDTLLFIISTLKNYFPKGLSYFLVHEMPWILKPFWHIAKAWVPEEHRQLIKFSDSRTIFEYVDRDQLPDYMGGLGQPEEYKRVPENCVNLEQASKLWGIERPLMRRVYEKFRENLPPETVARIDEYLDPKIDSAHELANDDTDDGLVADLDPEKAQ